MALGPYRSTSVLVERRDEAVEAEIEAFGAAIRSERRRAVVRAIRLHTCFLAAVALVCLISMWLSFDVSFGLAVSFIVAAASMWMRFGRRAVSFASGTIRR